MTALDDKQLEEFKNIVLEKNNIVLDEEIVKLLNRLEPKKAINTYPYSVSSNNVKIWLQIHLYSLNKFVSAKSNSQEIYFEKEINKFYKIKIILDKKRLKVNLRIGHFKFPYFVKYFLINSETNEQKQFNFDFNYIGVPFYEHLTIQEPEIVYKRFCLHLKSYFYYLDEYIKIIKPYFDNLVEEE